jgi:uncharacterized membrane protein YsdA (DUF1294 family)
MKPYLIFLAVMALVSLVAFFAYGLDKRKAKKGSWRTKESVLLGLGFFGGAIGALLGMKVYRHKTKHWYFWVVNVLGLSWQIGAVVYLFLNF